MEAGISTPCDTTKEEKTNVYHEKCVGLCGVWPSRNKCVGTSGLVTVCNTKEHKVTI